MSNNALAAVFLIGVFTLIALGMVLGKVSL